jgi:predicted ATPase
MVVGEPGIGKSALCEQLMAFAAQRGARALVGHCYEAGTSGASVPYMPFVEGLRGYVMDTERHTLRAELGAGAAGVAWILPELAERLDIVPRPHGDPQNDRWHVLQAVAGLLRDASVRQPLLLVFEDLHDADRNTLDMLLHVTRTLQDARLLVVGHVSRHRGRSRAPGLCCPG